MSNTINENMRELRAKTTDNYKLLYIHRAKKKRVKALERERKKTKCKSEQHKKRIRKKNIVN